MRGEVSRFPVFQDAAVAPQAAHKRADESLPAGSNIGYLSRLCQLPAASELFTYATEESAVDSRGVRLSRRAQKNN